MLKPEANTKVTPEPKQFGQTGSFVRDNQKSLLFISVAVLALIVGYIAYQKLYLAPREVKATDQMYVAQQAWQQKNWDKALKGDAGYPGFEKIISEYSNTKAANLAYYYAGIAYLNKGQYGKAVENLTNYHGDDYMIAAEALGSTGDAYVQMNKLSDAESYFKKAADKANNKFLSPLYLKKLGLVYEAENKPKDALDTYKKIKADYPESTEAQSIDAYIGRTEAKQ
ncbi:tetratricopeptide repeat protein [Mucilaginibacter koreensis]